jgi:autotransporter strand-loop-strand O-heptosyltransferase
VERARWLLLHAEFFICLSSGLSWLAWAVGTTVVMISGFTHPTNQCSTPYRVINYHTCNGCWTDRTNVSTGTTFFFARAIRTRRASLNARDSSPPST